MPRKLDCEVAVKVHYGADAGSAVIPNFQRVAEEVMGTVSEKLVHNLDIRDFGVNVHIADLYFAPAAGDEHRKEVSA